MAVYFEPQRQDKSFASGFSKGLTQMAQMYMQQQLQQGNMEKASELGMNRDANQVGLSNQMNQNKVNMNQGLMDKTFGANAQVPIAQGQNPIFIEGQMNPTNTGMTQQQLNQMKAQGLTGVNPTQFIPKAPKAPTPKGYNTTVQNGETFTTNQDTGEVKTGGQYRPPAQKQVGLTDLGKTFEEMKNFPEGSPQYKAYTAYVNYKTSGKISPELQMMMQIMNGQGGQNLPNQAQQTDKFGFSPQTPQKVQKQPSVLDYYKD